MYELYVLNDHNFFSKKETLCFCVSSLLLQKSSELSELPFCVCFFSSENVFLGILLVWSDRFHCLDVRRLSLDVRRLRKERLARFSICLHNKRGFDHVESERTFYTYIQSIAICFKFDPLLHSSRLDITPFLSLYLTLPCPESWLPPPLPFNNTL